MLLRDLSFLLIMGPHAGGEVYDEIVSQPILPSLIWFSSRLSAVWFTQPAFRLFEEEICPYTAADGVCPGGW